MLFFIRTSLFYASMLNKQVNEERNGRNKIKKDEKKHNSNDFMKSKEKQQRKAPSMKMNKARVSDWRAKSAAIMRFIRACTAQCTLCTHCIWINVSIQCATWALIPFKDNFHIISVSSSWPFILQNTHTHHLISVPNRKENITSIFTNPTLNKSKTNETKREENKKPKQKTMNWSLKWAKQTEFPQSEHTIDLACAMHALGFVCIAFFFSCNKPRKQAMRALLRPRDDAFNGISNQAIFYADC